MRIDFHTHLLPGVDDGSQSVAESQQLLNALRSQEVELAIATPHFYSAKASLDEFLQRRDAAYAQLQAEVKPLTPKLLLGAEVSFFRGMHNADRLQELCIADTSALLLEMPFSQWGQGELTELQQLLNRGVTPIIAHVERYFSYQKDMSAFLEIINLPVILQVDTEALMQRKTRKLVFRLIEQDFPVLLGTDCHDIKKRKPDMDAACKILRTKFGDACMEQIDSLGAQLLHN